MEKKKRQEQAKSNVLSNNRPIGTTLPVATSLLKPEAYNAREIKARMNSKQGIEKRKYYQDRHGTQELPPLKPGDHVRVTPEPGSKEWSAAMLVGHHTSPRSYVVAVGHRRIRRNRVAIMRTDSLKSHTELQKSQADSVHHPEPAPPCIEAHY